MKPIMYSKDYRRMFSVLKKMNNPTIKDIGELVCLEYNLTSSAYEERLNRRPSDLLFIGEDKERFDLYTKYVAIYEEQLKQDLESYKIIFYSFLQSNYATLEDFSKAANIDHGFLNYVLLVTNFIDRDLYNQILEETEKRKNTLVSENIVICQKALEQIENGVETDKDTVRDFDIVDYYTLTKIDPKTLYLSVKPYFSIMSIQKFKLFANKFSRDQKLSYDDLQKKFEEKIEFDCEKDKNNRAIIGTGKVITDNDKTLIFQYLLANNIPLTEGTYNAMIKRYRQEYLHNKKHVKTKSVQA